MMTLKWNSIARFHGALHKHASVDAVKHAQLKNSQTAVAMTQVLGLCWGDSLGCRYRHDRFH